MSYTSFLLLRTFRGGEGLVLNRDKRCLLRQESVKKSTHLTVSGETVEQSTFHAYRNDFSAPFCKSHVFDVCLLDATAHEPTVLKTPSRCNIEL